MLKAKKHVKKLRKLNDNENIVFEGSAVFLGDVELRASYDSILLLPVISKVVVLLLSY
jgi:hypothetical protein